MSLLGIVRGFRLKVGPTTPARFEGPISELVAGHPSLEAIAQGLLAVRVALRRKFDRFEKQVHAMARRDTRTRLLMSVPGVGAIVSLTFAAAIDDPARFKSSKQVGAYFGLTPTKYQSGETDIDGRISKIGDASVRTVLRGRQHHFGQATQGLHGIEELGDEARQAERDEESQGGAGAQNRHHHASDAGRWHELP
jgi:transposase